MEDRLQCKNARVKKKTSLDPFINKKKQGKCCQNEKIYLKIVGIFQKFTYFIQLKNSFETGKGTFLLPEIFHTLV